MGALRNTTAEALSFCRFTCGFTPSFKIWPSNTVQEMQRELPKRSGVAIALGVNLLPIIFGVENASRLVANW